MYSSEQNASLAINTVFPILAVVSTILRFIARINKSNPIGIDDWLVLLSAILCLSIGVAVVYDTAVGCFAVTLESMTTDQYIRFAKLLYAVPIPCFTASGVIKLSILCFYKRIFTTRRFIIVSNVFIVLVILWTLAGVAGVTFQYWPINENWSLNPNLNAETINFPVFLIIIAILDLALDVAILCLPIYPVSKLQMSTQQKCSVLGIFTLGSLCCVAEAVRIYLQRAYLNALATATDPIADSTELIFQIFYWATIEICLSTVAANLPTFGVLLNSKRSEAPPRARLPSLTPLRYQSWLTLASLSRKRSRESADEVAQGKEGEERKKWQVPVPFVHIEIVGGLPAVAESPAPVSDLREA